MTVRSLTRLAACLLITGCLLLAGGCDATSGPPTHRSPPTRAARPSRPVSYDWLSIDRIHRALLDLENIDIATARLRVIDQFQVAGQTVIMLSLDRGQMPGLTIAREREFYAVSARIAQHGLVVPMGAGGATVYQLGSLPFRLEPSLYTFHYVLIVGPKDGAVIDGLPSPVFGVGLAVTTELDTATLSVLQDIGRPSNLAAAATEACQATVQAVPTRRALLKLEQARRKPHPAPDLKELLSSYYDLGQEVSCNGLGQAMAGRSMHMSWSLYHTTYPVITLSTPDGRLEGTWAQPRAIYRLSA